MIFRIITALLPVLLLAGCSQNKFSAEQFRPILNKDNTILITCIKCNCVLDELNVIYKTNPQMLAAYEIVADSNCVQGLLNKAIPYRHVSQGAIDSCSYEFTNMLIIKGKKIKELQTMQVKKMPLYLQL